MIRLVIASVFLAIGLFVFLSEVVGFMRFRYVMTRIHAAGIGDTLGIACICIGVGILIGTVNAALKLLLIVGFMFLTSPVLTHLIANVEMKLHHNLGQEYTEEDR